MNLQTTSPRLPLYLQGKRPTQVGADGPALRVIVANGAPLRYPLARLARVISTQRVNWRGEAIAACLCEGLPIVFLDNAGEPAGYLMPLQGKPSRLDGLLEELLALPEGDVCYNNWLRAARMSLLHAWRHRREQAGEPIAEEEFHELIHRHLYQPELENHAFVRAGPYAGALLARVLQALHQAGLKPRYWCHQGRPIELAADIAQLLGLSLYLDMRGFMDQAQGDNAALLYLLHKAGSRLETGLTELLGSLHRRVKIRVEEWR
ncbi:MAG: hypothetical protein A2514_08240 [Gammaproteobacteria bacterium RIFOXYD12_FULL_61_37]|nr:MAG: hypothetical protein A2514_08240 [Gammaproteobacteria bacterium RIFOXYD12_FULL_61_37]